MQYVGQLEEEAVGRSSGVGHGCRWMLPPGGDTTTSGHDTTVGSL